MSNVFHIFNVKIEIVIVGKCFKKLIYYNMIQSFTRHFITILNVYNFVTLSQHYNCWGKYWYLTLVQDIHPLIFLVLELPKILIQEVLFM